MKHLIRALFAVLLLSMPAYATSGTQLILLSQAGVTATTTGKSFIPSPKGNHFLCSIVASKVAGTTPTLDGKVEYSVDGTHWKTMCTFTQITTAVDSSEVVHVPVSTFNVPAHLRGTATLGGTTPSYDVLIAVYYQIGE